MTAQKGSLHNAKEGPEGPSRKHGWRLAAPSGDCYACSSRSMPVEPVRRLQDLGRDGVEQNRQFVANEADAHDDREGDAGGDQAVLNSGGAGLVLERLELLDGRDLELQHNTLLNAG